jgi:hypothetical protein
LLRKAPQDEVFFISKENLFILAERSRKRTRHEGRQRGYRSFVTRAFGPLREGEATCRRPTSDQKTGRRAFAFPSTHYEPEQAILHGRSHLRRGNMRGGNIDSGQGVHAFVKDPIACGAEAGPAVAPRGDYDIEAGGDCVGLCNCATKNRFTLSFDAYLQHLNEGRIALEPAR